MTSEEGVADDTSRADSAFLQAARQSLAVELNDVSDADLLTAGEAVCAALDRGIEPIEILVSGMETSGDLAPVLLGAAASTLCREHLAAVQALAEAL